MKTYIQNGRSRHQRGFTLAEVLVASAIFTVIIVAALLMYDRSNQVFKNSSQAIDMQQNSRVAFDKLVSDLRMTGFDYDRDGIPTGSAANAWRQTTAYVPGDYVVPTTANGHQYLCTSGGTSGGTEPTWPTSTNGTVTEPSGGPTWQENAGVNQYQQPDEQIEYAGQTAITIRANFDYETESKPCSGMSPAADCDNGRERQIETATPQFPVITTDNDEIVTYALVSDKGPNNDSVTFYADVNAVGTSALASRRRAYPGGSPERLVTIDGVDLSNNNPPYTLYRITLNDDATPNRTPVASNIRSLRFKYYEDTTESTPLKDLQSTPADVSNGIGGGGQYNPNNPGVAVAERLIRAKIKSISVQLIGMDTIADNNYTDVAPSWTGSADTISPHTRKIALSTLVVPRNLGKRGLREGSTSAPGAPSITKVCTGYCGLVRLEWAAPAGGGVSQYAIQYDVSQNGLFTASQQVGPVTSGYVSGLTPDVPYYFKVEALNDYGSASSEILGPYTPKSSTTPGDPNTATLTATGGGGSNPAALSNEIDLTWTRPTSFASGADQLTCSPGGNSTANPIPSQENITYNIWRSTTSTVDTSQPAYVTYNAVSNTPTTNFVTNVVSWKDTHVLNCKTYWYKVQAVKPTCEGHATYFILPSQPHSAAVPGTAISGAAVSTGSAPAAPADLQVIDATSTCAVGVCTVNLQWTKVVTDTANKALLVDAYEIERTQKLNGTITTAASSPQTITGVSNTAYGTTSPRLSSTGWATNTTQAAAQYGTYTDTVPQADSSGTAYSYEYHVRALQCSSPGAYSVIRTFPCPFTGGTVTVAVGPSFQGNGSSSSPYEFASAGTITVTTTSPVTAAHALVYAGNASTGPWTLMAGGDLGVKTGPLTTANWSFNGTVGTYYLVDVSVTDSGGCTKTQSVQAYAAGTTCCLQNVTNDSTVFSFTSGTTNYVDIFLKNVCTNDLSLQPAGVSVTFDSTGLSNGTKIGNLIYPTTLTSGSGVANCPAGFGYTKCITFNWPNNNNAGTFTTTALSNAQAVPASSSAYKIRITFSNNLPRQPITAATITYRRSGIDLSDVSCQIK